MLLHRKQAPEASPAHCNPANQKMSSASISLCKIKKEEANIKGFIKKDVIIRIKSGNY